MRQPLEVAIMAWRWEGQTVPSGSRIDVKCVDCGAQVVLMPKSVQMMETHKTRIFCLECAAKRQNRPVEELKAERRKALGL